MTPDRSSLEQLFKLPSDTGMLLTLLASATVACSLYFGYTVGQGVSPGIIAGQVVQWDKLDSVYIGQEFNILLAIFVFCLFQFATYVRQVRWLRIRNYPIVLEQVTRLAEEYGCREPRTLIDPRLGCGAMVARSYYFQRRLNLVIGPGLVALAGKPDPSLSGVFDTVLRHEFGHIANGDARMYRQASFVRAVYQSWCFLLLGVHALTTWLPAMTWRNVVLMGFSMVGIELLHRAFLRSREHYADLRAGQGGTAGMSTLLGGVRPDHPVPFHTHLLRRHPPMTARRRVLQDPLSLVGVPVVYLAAAGIIAGFALTSLDFVFVELGSDIPGSVWETRRVLVEALFIGLSLGSFVAVTVWRETWSSRSNKKPMRWAAFGVALGAGMILGRWLPPFNRPTLPAWIPTKRPEWGQGPDILLGEPTAAILAAMALFLFLSAFSMLWQHISRALHPTRAFRWVTTLVAITATGEFVAIFAAGNAPLFGLLFMLGGALASSILLGMKQIQDDGTRPLAWVTALVGLPVLGAVVYATDVALARMGS